MTVSRAVLATTLCLATLAGCTSLPFSTITTSKVSTARAPFVSAATATLGLTSTTQVTSAGLAKALAAHDESLIESASAGLEADEATANYTTLALPDGGDEFGGFFGPEAPKAGNKAQPPQQGKQHQPLQQQRPQQGGQMGDRPAEPGRQGGFRMGEFGGGFEEMEGAPRPRIERHAQQPPKAPMLSKGQGEKLEQRRDKAGAKRKDFITKNAKNHEDEAMIRQVLNAQPWQPGTDEGTLTKSGTNTLTLASGVSRKVAVLRVVSTGKPHALVLAQTDISDAYADGATKTAHWEKALQEDGSYHMAYHHAYTDAAGTTWVADWTKTLQADGKLIGTGTFTQTDAQGTIVSSQTLTLGGDDTNGQTITAEGTDAAPATDAEAATELSAVFTRFYTLIG